jgi:hypothetical protein
MVYAYTTVRDFFGGWVVSKFHAVMGGALLLLLLLAISAYGHC